MKVRTSIVGITLMTAGLVGAAAAQGPGLPMTPAGNPTKQEAKCLFELASQRVRHGASMHRHATFCTVSWEDLKWAPSTPSFCVCALTSSS